MKYLLQDKSTKNEGGQNPGPNITRRRCRMFTYKMHIKTVDPCVAPLKRHQGKDENISGMDFREGTGRGEALSKL